MLGTCPFTPHKEINYAAAIVAGSSTYAPCPLAICSKITSTPKGRPRNLSSIWSSGWLEPRSRTSYRHLLPASGLSGSLAKTAS